METSSVLKSIKQLFWCHQFRHSPRYSNRVLPVYRIPSILGLLTGRKTIAHNSNLGLLQSHQIPLKNSGNTYVTWHWIQFMISERKYRSLLSSTGVGWSNWDSLKILKKGGDADKWCMVQVLDICLDSFQIRSCTNYDSSVLLQLDLTVWSRCSKIWASERLFMMKKENTFNPLKLIRSIHL